MCQLLELRLSALRQPPAQCRHLSVRSLLSGNRAAAERRIAAARRTAERTRRLRCTPGGREAALFVSTADFEQLVPGLAELSAEDRAFFHEGALKVLIERTRGYASDEARREDINAEVGWEQFGDAAEERRRREALIGAKLLARGIETAEAHRHPAAGTPRGRPRGGLLGDWCARRLSRADLRRAARPDRRRPAAIRHRPRDAGRRHRLTMDGQPGETPIKLMASDSDSDRCLRFHQAAVPDLDVGKVLLFVRGEVGSRVVRGCRAAGAETSGVVTASPALCEAVTGGTGGGEFDALVSAARRGQILTDLPRGARLTLALTLLALVGGIAGVAGALIASSAPIGIAAAIAILAALGLGARAAGEVHSALKIDCS